MLLGNDNHTSLKNDSALVSLNKHAVISVGDFGMSNQVSERLFNIFLRFAWVLEPLAPPAISYFISRRLDHLRHQGLISNYRAETRRLGKFHYKIQLDLDLNATQAFHVVDDMLPKQLKHLKEVELDE